MNGTPFHNRLSETAAVPGWLEFELSSVQMVFILTKFVRYFDLPIFSASYDIISGGLVLLLIIFLSHQSLVSK